jgi:hypothetical protein
MDMGRITSGSMRTRIQDYMIQLKKQYRAALKDSDLQNAFDELFPTWSSEMAAMIYAEVLSALDLILLTAAIDNRREIMKLREQMEQNQN